MAEASEASPSALECPVCGEDFTDPKLLPCNHVICRKCIVDWLKKSGRNGGCPLCRAAILDAADFTSAIRDEDLEPLVDALPTDLALVAKVESSRVLSSRHVCMSCDTNTAASSFCLQCNMKLCKACVKVHGKFSAMKNHVVEGLENLTAERLAEINRIPCKNHDDRLAELYCSAHQELICLLCSSTSHRFCDEVKAIKDAAAEKRKEFDLMARRLRDKEVTMRTQIKNCKEKFAEHHAKSERIFNDLMQCLEKRQREVAALIQAEEDKMALKQLEQVRASITSQAGVLESLLGSAPDDALLDMERSMVSRINALEQDTDRAYRIHEPEEWTFDPRILRTLELSIAVLGKQGQTPSRPLSSGLPNAENPTPSTYSTELPSPLSPPSSTTTTTFTSKSATSTSSSAASAAILTSSSTSTSTSTTTTFASSTTLSSSTFVVKKPRGSKLAQILKEGDRVRLNPDVVSWPEELRSQIGTVVNVPSKWRVLDNLDPKGCVDVQWDNGQSDWYGMGRGGFYDLDLA